MTAVIAVELAKILPVSELVAAVVMTAINAALTIGGKAFGKNLAMNYCEKIIYVAGRIICFIVPDKYFTKNKK